MHHPFRNPEDFLYGYNNFRSAYIALCINNLNHVHHMKDTLPAEADYQEPQSDDESENEDVPDLRGDDNFWLIGCERLDKDLIRKWNLWLII